MVVYPPQGLHADAVVQEAAARGGALEPTFPYARPLETLPRRP